MHPTCVCGWKGTWHATLVILCVCPSVSFHWISCSVHVWDCCCLLLFVVLHCLLYLLCWFKSIEGWERLCRQVWWLCSHRAAVCNGRKKWGPSSSCSFLIHTSTSANQEWAWTSQWYIYPCTWFVLVNDGYDWSATPEALCDVNCRFAWNTEEMFMQGVKQWQWKTWLDYPCVVKEDTRSYAYYAFFIMHAIYTGRESEGADLPPQPDKAQLYLSRKKLVA